MQFDDELFRKSRLLMKPIDILGNDRQQFSSLVQADDGAVRNAFRHSESSESSDIATVTTAG